MVAKPQWSKDKPNWRNGNGGAPPIEDMLETSRVHLRTGSLRQRLVLSSYSKQHCLIDLMDIGKDIVKRSKPETYNPPDRKKAKEYQPIVWLLRKTYSDITRGEDPIKALTTLEKFMPMGEAQDRLTALIEKAKSSTWMNLDYISSTVKKVTKTMAARAIKLSAIRVNQKFHKLAPSGRPEWDSKMGKPKVYLVLEEPEDIGGQFVSVKTDKGHVVDSRDSQVYLA